MPEELPVLPPPEPTSVRGWLLASVKSVWRKAEKAILSLRALSFPGLVLSGFPAYFLSPILVLLAKFPVIAPAVMFSGIVFGTIDVTSVEKIKEIAVGNAGVLGGAAGVLGLFLIFQQWYRMSRVLKHLRVGEIFEAFQNFLYVFAPLITVGFWSWILTFGLPTILKSYVIPLVLVLGGATWVVGDTLSIEGFIKANLGVAAAIMAIWFVVLGYTHKYVHQLLRLFALTVRALGRVFTWFNPETVTKILTWTTIKLAFLVPISIWLWLLYEFWSTLKEGGPLTFIATILVVAVSCFVYMVFEEGCNQNRRDLTRTIARHQGRSAEYLAALEAKWVEDDQKAAAAKELAEAEAVLAKQKALETPAETSARWAREAAEREATKQNGSKLTPLVP